MSKARQLADLGNQIDDGAITGSNMVTNGAMTVAQRGVSFTGVTANGYYACDRWFSNIQNGTWTISQEADAPDGFSKSIKYLCTATGAAQVVQHAQIIEGSNAQQLAYGTSSAKDITVSFWVKSNVTGTYAMRMYNPQGVDRLISQNYTITASGVWEYKTITFAGDTVRDIADGNVYGINAAWWLSAGSSFSTGSTSTVWQDYASVNEAPNQVDVAASVNNYWQITGVCLNVGDSAIDFPHDERYGDTLAKCQRYFERQTGIDGIGVSSSASNCYGGALRYNFKRTTPIISIRDSGGTANKITWNTAGVSGENVSSSVTSTTISATRPFTTSTTSARNSFVISVLDIDAEL